MSIKMKYSLIILVVLAAAALVIGLQRRAGLPVEMAAIKKGRIRQVVEERARTEYRSERVVTVLISGLVGAIMLEEGSKVGAGDVIATLQEKQVAAAVNEAESQVINLAALMESVDIGKPKPEQVKAAELAVAQARGQLVSLKTDMVALEQAVRTAEFDLNNAKTLRRSGTISERDLMTAEDAAASARAMLDKQSALIKVAELAVEIADANLAIVRNYRDDTEYVRKSYQAQIDGMKSRLEGLRDQLDHTVVRAPIGGVILERYTRGDAFLMAGSPLVRIGDPATLEVRMEILTDDAGRVRKGQAVDLSGSLLGGTIVTGQVDRIFPAGFIKISTLGVEQERVVVMISVNGKDLPFGPTYGFDGKIVVAEVADAILVPERAVFKLNGDRCVFVVTDGAAHMRKIKTGIESSESFEVLEGLTEGETVVVGPPSELMEGARVTPAK
ncbi:MAG: efflux RND transporter periplasmic adaptor subunit [Candidatus Brocadiia bacterium]